MIENYLQEIGLNKNEAKVYVELNQLGPQPASVISKRLSFNRSSLYSVLESLCNKGLISYIDNQKVRFFTVNDPNSLIAFVDKKCSRFNYYRNQTIAIIPKIREKQAVYKVKKSKYQFFDGISALKNEFHHLCSNSKSLTAFFPNNTENYIFSVFLSLLNTKKIKINLILPKTFEKQVLVLKYPIKRLVYEQNLDVFENLSQFMVMFDDKFCFLNLERNFESLLLIEDKGYFHTMKTLLDFNYKIFN